MHYGIPSFDVGTGSGDLADWLAGFDLSGARTNGRGPYNNSEKSTYFSPRFQGFQIGVSYVPEPAQDAEGPPNEADGAREDLFASGVNYARSFNNISIRPSAGYQDIGEDDALAGKNLES